MAVVVRPFNARVQIQFELGVDENGKKLTRTKTLSNIKTDADEQDIFDVVSALVGLQENQVGYVRKIDQSELVNG